MITDLEIKGIIYSGHLARRLFERNIKKDIIKWLILNGKAIEEYKDDYPCPSLLLFGEYNEIAYHLVIANCEKSLVAITIYTPDPNVWEDNRRRIK